MPIRRAADPTSVQHVWDAIRQGGTQRQIADSKKIVKYLQKVDKCTDAQAELYIQQTLQDGLIVIFLEVTKPLKPPLDGKDWYCFECHLAGDVTTCAKCFRVYHSDCVPNGHRKFQEFKKSTILYRKSAPILSESEDLNATNGTSDKVSFNNNEGNKEEVNAEVFDDNLCSICNIAKLSENCVLDKAELNYLLKFVIHRIQAWLPHTLTHTMSDEERPEWLTNGELEWRANQLFFQHKDMSVIEVHLNSEHYNFVHEFLADVLTIQHNVAIFHGIESQEYGASELMVRDCMHDLTELQLCVDCYRHSNEKINPKWFCLPCRVPHQLVWAKQKGYPYWPAKVIQETRTHYDVRFFGGKYERSLLAKSFIKPIETPQSKLQIKPSTAFNKAVDELKFHQKLLQNPEELQKLIKESKTRPRSVMKARNSIKKPSVNKSTTSQRSSDSYEITDVYQFDDSSLGQPERFKQSPSKRMHDEAPHNVSDGVIHISDGEDDEFSYRQNYTSTPNLNYNGAYDQVSSSTEYYRPGHPNRSQENGLQRLNQPYSDSVEKLRKKMEILTDKKDLIKCAVDTMQMEIDTIVNEHNEHLKKLFESHNAQISETKKKQWCYNCEQDAIYHCCWNTAYCSQSCQQQHWQTEHKKVCRRKR